MATYTEIFVVIIFENFELYDTLSKENREVLDNYSRQNSVGIIGFLTSTKLDRSFLHNLPLQVFKESFLSDYHLNSSSPVLRITKAGETYIGSLPGRDWITFKSNHTSYQAIAQATLHTDNDLYEDISYRDPANPPLGTTVILVSLQFFSFTNIFKRVYTLK